MKKLLLLLLLSLAAKVSQCSNAFESAQDDSVGWEIIKSPATNTLAFTNKNLKGCIAELDAEGGWCELEVTSAEPGISNVYADVPSSWGPQRNTLSAWCGMAVDDANKVLYFTCGGHGDYVGNEIYAFYLNEGKWERITEPSPLDHIAYDWGSTSSYIKVPDLEQVPGAQHTYDSIIHDPSSNKIYALAMRPANRLKDSAGSDQDANFISESEGKYVFDVATRTWSKLNNNRISYAKTAFAPDGTLYVSKNSRIYTMDKATGVAITAKSMPDYGDGSMTFDASRNSLWMLTKTRLRRYDVSDWSSMPSQVAPIKGRSVALDKDNNPTLWNGCDKVATFDPIAEMWDTVTFTDPELAGCSETDRVYSKWHHLGDNVFVGVVSEDQGVLIYKKP